MDVNISQLRQHLPEYLDRVRQGEHIRVTSRGRVVAEIAPPAPAPGQAAALLEPLQGSSMPRYDDPIAAMFAGDQRRTHRQ